MQHEQNSSAKTGVGTPIYMAPEIIYGGNRYDAKARLDLPHVKAITSACLHQRYTGAQHMPVGTMMARASGYRHGLKLLPVIDHRKRTSGRAA